MTKNQPGSQTFLLLAVMEYRMTVARSLRFTFPIVMLASLAAVALSATANAQEVLGRLQSEYKAVYAKAKSSVLAVSSVPFERIDLGNPLQAGPTAATAGTGWVYRDQYVVTSIENAFPAAMRAAGSLDVAKAMRELKLYYAITANGDTHECAVAGYDIPSLTLVLRLPNSAKIQGLPLSNAAPVIGTTVASLGNSFDSILQDGEVSFSVGSLSDAYRMEPVGLTDTTDEPGDPVRGTLLEFEGAGNPGDYGGPLLDMSGSVVGMITAHHHSGRRLPVAMPALSLAAALDSIIDKKPIEPTTLGIYISKAGRDEAPKEGIILSVTEGSYAERAGLKRGDEIVLIDGWRMSGFSQISNAFGTRYTVEGQGQSASVISYGVPRGSSILVTVRREGKLLTKEIIAGTASAMPTNSAGSASKAADQDSIAKAAGRQRHLVQVITDWNRTADDLPANESNPIAALAGQGDDPIFFDTRIGPYTGVVVGADGEILVSDQMLGDFIEGRPAGISQALRQVYVVLPDGRTLVATVAGRNQETGLALLKIDAKGLEPVEFTKDTPKSAELLTLVSRANHHIMHSVRGGVVSAVSRNGGDEFQFDARVGSCDLGSLVLNANGQPIGIMTSLDSRNVGKASGVAMAVYGSKSLDKALVSLRKGEFLQIPPQPFLGVAANPAYANRPGLKVGNITRGSAASLAGIRDGDVILEVEGKPMNRTADLVEIIRSKKVGDSLTIKLDREGEELEVTAILQARGR